MASKETAIKRLSKASFERIIEAFLIKHLMPWGGAALAALLGYVGSVPILWIFVAMCLTFASITTGLVQYSAWREQNTVANRLGVQAPQIGEDLDTGNLSIKIHFINLASFPIQWEVVELRSHIDGRVSTSPSMHIGQVYVSPPGGNGWWTTNHVPNTDIANRRNRAIEGVVEATIKFGKVNKMNQELKINKSIMIRFDENGAEIGQDHHDVLT